VTHNASRQGRRRHFLDRYYNDPKVEKEGRQRAAGRRALQILRKFLDPSIPAGIPLEEARQLLAEQDKRNEIPSTHP